MPEKVCSTCKVPKELDAFAPTKQKLRFGVRSVCRDCERDYKREWVKKDPIRKLKQVAEWKASNREKVRAWNRAYSKRMRKERPEQLALYELRARLKREYGVTIEWRNSKREAQNNICAICGGPPGTLGLAIDHNHNTGKVRDLLCCQCNTGLHKMERDIEWIRKAAAYLARHGD